VKVGRSGLGSQAKNAGARIEDSLLQNIKLQFPSLLSVTVAFFSPLSKTGTARPRYAKVKEKEGFSSLIKPRRATIGVF